MSRKREEYCFDLMDGACARPSETCWFRHDLPPSDTEAYDEAVKRKEEYLRKKELRKTPCIVQYIYGYEEIVVGIYSNADHAKRAIETYVSTNPRCRDGDAWEHEFCECLREEGDDRPEDPKDHYWQAGNHNTLEIEDASRVGVDVWNPSRRPPKVPTPLYPGETIYVLVCYEANLGLFSTRHAAEEYLRSHFPDALGDKFSGRRIVPLVVDDVLKDL